MDKALWNVYQLLGTESIIAETERLCEQLDGEAKARDERVNQFLAWFGSLSEEQKALYCEASKDITDREERISFYMSRYKESIEEQADGTSVS